MWGKADTPNPSEGLNPEAYGWCKEQDEYQPVWFEGPALPEHLRNASVCSTEELHTEQNTEEDDLEDIQEVEWSESSEDEDDD